MKTRYIDKLVAVMLYLFSLTACSTDSLEPVDKLVEEGESFYTQVELAVPAYNLPATRGRAGVEDIHSLSILVFDEYDEFIYRAETTLKETKTDGTYSFQAKLKTSAKKRTLHFIANLDSSTEEDLDLFIGDSIEDLMEQLALPYQVYWAGYSFSVLTEYTLRNRKIYLLRNQALVEVVNKDPNFTMSGFIVLNYPDTGFALPKNYKDMMNLTSPKRPTQVWEAESELLQDNKYDFSSSPRALFEYSSTAKTPISIVVKGKRKGESGEKFFRVELIRDYDKQLHPIYVSVLRNHKYKIILDSVDFNLHNTLAEAKKKAAINNHYEILEEYLGASGGRLHTLMVQDKGALLVRSGQVFTTEVFFSKGVSNVRFEPSWTSTDSYLSSYKFTPSRTDANRGILEIRLKNNPPYVAKEYSLDVIASGEEGSIYKRAIPIKVSRPYFLAWQSFSITNLSYFFSILEFKLPEDLPGYLYPIRAKVSVKNASLLEYSCFDFQSEKSIEFRPLLTFDNGTYYYEILLYNNSYRLSFSKTEAKDIKGSEVIIETDYTEPYRQTIAKVDY